MNKSKISVKKTALAAILSALGIVLLAVGSIIETLDLSSAALAGFVIVIGVIELGGRYPLMMYFVISVLSVLVLPNKFSALFFIFGGFYPMFKAYVERFHNIIAWTLKFSVFNTFFIFIILAVRFLIARNLLPPVSEDNFLFENFKFVVFLVANLTFLLYDIAMTRIINLYIVKIRKIIGLENYF